MNVFLATDHCSGDYGAWFPQAKVIRHEDETPATADLLILSGGSDISPKRYGEKNISSYGIDMIRDEREFAILKKIINTCYGVKVLGICRGAQLLNVFCGGDLHQDISSIGKEHKAVHSLCHFETNPLSWLTYSNSLHHQAIRHVESGRVLAVEPTTDIIEVAAWRNWGLGVQFHPEMFLPELGDRFFSVIEKWVAGEVRFDSYESPIEEGEDTDE